MNDFYRTSLTSSKYDNENCPTVVKDFVKNIQEEQELSRISTMEGEGPKDKITTVD